MKPLPPSQVIAEYDAAYFKAHGRMMPAVLHYENGWFRFSDIPGRKFRGAQIIHMTATLNERAKAKG